MTSLWRVHWAVRERTGCGSAMSREQALAAAARSNAIDPATAHWVEPIQEQELAPTQRQGLAEPLHLPG